MMKTLSIWKLLVNPLEYQRNYLKLRNEAWEQVLYEEKQKEVQQYQKRKKI
jgi:hypothetical protein